MILTFSATTQLYFSNIMTHSAVMYNLNLEY